MSVRRLDDLVRGRRVGFIKIDVEGYEVAVLRGGMGIISESRPTLLIEIEERHRKGALEEVCGLLKPLGYRGFYLHSGRFEPVESFDPEQLQNAAALDADGAYRLPGRTYINNFIFAARPDVLNVLASPDPVSEDNMSIDKQRLAQYCASGRKQVHGWLNPVDAEMFLQVLLLQDGLGIQGGTAEIGVHHGKSFIPLCLGLRDNERALCIDIFEDQSHNVDLSGQGSREKLDHNLKRFSVPANRVVVLKASSFDVSARQIVDAVGNVQFFSVDGGHWRDIVVNDLGIAGDAVGEKGVIALDDFLHKEWPDVYAGVLRLAPRAPARILAPLAISPNKLYLVRKESFGIYAERLFAIPSLRSQILKYYNFLDQRVPILSQRYPSFVLALKNRLEQANPGLYEKAACFQARPLLTGSTTPYAFAGRRR